MAPASKISWLLFPKASRVGDKCTVTLQKERALSFSLALISDNITYSPCCLLYLTRWQFVKQKTGEERGLCLVTVFMEHRNVTGPPVSWVTSVHQALLWLSGSHVGTKHILLTKTTQTHHLCLLSLSNSVVLLDYLPDLFKYRFLDPRHRVSDSVCLVSCKLPGDAAAPDLGLYVSVTALLQIEVLRAFYSIPAHLSDQDLFFYQYQWSETASHCLLHPSPSSSPIPLQLEEVDWHSRVAERSWVAVPFSG